MGGGRSFKGGNDDRAERATFMIAVVDYGMGNLRSVQKALEQAGDTVVVTSDPGEVRSAERVVVPGVGAFKDAMNSLGRLGLITPLLEAIEGGKPYLGICLGMQILMTESEEFGPHKGLRVIRGRVSRLPDTAGKIPHVGWNRVNVRKNSPLLKMQDDGGYFYFVHSYYTIPDDHDVWAGATKYGVEFCSLLWKDNIFATQFHPEKSQERGLQILRRFVQWHGQKEPLPCS